MMKKAKPFHGPGPDGIPTVQFCTVGPGLPLLLLNSFSLFMSRSTFPSRWKTSIIVPHYKKGSMHNPKDFHPNNHTHILSCLVENVAKIQLVSFLTAHNLIKIIDTAF